MAFIEPWRASLLPASFRGAEFHVEIGAKAGGRRTVTHEYPKRDDPFGEDMGRKAKRFTVNAYIVDGDYIPLRDALVDACETEGSGLLVHPTMGELLVLCDAYSVSERRERGRMCEFELTFSEAGLDDAFSISTSTQAQVGSAAAAATPAVTASADGALGKAAFGRAAGPV